MPLSQLAEGAFERYMYFSPFSPDSIAFTCLGAWARRMYIKVVAFMIDCHMSDLMCTCRGVRLRPSGMHELGEFLMCIAMADVGTCMCACVLARM